MGLLETLVVGAYVYTTAFGVFLYKLVTGNHLRHLDARLTAVEQKLSGRHP